MQTNSVLTLSRVSARFADEAPHHLALRDISFSIRQGSFVSLSGPSGSGKSTLMRVILGLMPTVGGEVVRNFKRPAMVFQNYALFPWLTALENVAFPVRMASAPASVQEKMAKEKLAEMGLTHIAHHYPAQLSGGQRQRVGLARALAMEPDFLILDEPFSNLDTITAEALKSDLHAIWRKYGMTILMVNHLIPDAIELSDEVLIMSSSPGEIHKVLSINLPHPRDVRSAGFYKLVDELTETLRATHS